MEMLKFMSQIGTLRSDTKGIFHALFVQNIRK